MHHRRPASGGRDEVGVPVGAGRVPDVHVGVDDAGGPVGHRASVRRAAVGPDDLPERGVEPIGDGGTAVGDAADRSGVAAKAEPAGADDQLGTGQRRCLGVAEQVGDELTDRLAGRLPPKPRCSRRRP